MEKKEREVKIYEIPEWYRKQNVPNLLRVDERLTKKRYRKRNVSNLLRVGARLTKKRHRMQNVPNLLRVGERLTKKEKPAASEKKGREVAANV